MDNEQKRRNYLIILISICAVALIGLILVGWVYLRPMFSKNKKAVLNSSNQNINPNNSPSAGSSIKPSTSPAVHNFPNQNSSSGASHGSFTPIVGTIQNIDTASSTINIQTSDGQTKSIVYSSSTRVSKQTNGQMTQLAIPDLTVGEQISVTGDSSQNPITARMIFVGTLTRPSGGQFNHQGRSNWTPPTSTSSNQ